MRHKGSARKVVPLSSARISFASPIRATVQMNILQIRRHGKRKPHKIGFAFYACTKIKTYRMVRLEVVAHIAREWLPAAWKAEPSKALSIVRASTSFRERSANLKSTLFLTRCHLPPEVATEMSSASTRSRGVIDGAATGVDAQPTVAHPAGGFKRLRGREMVHGCKRATLKASHKQRGVYKPHGNAVSAVNIAKGRVPIVHEGRAKSRRVQKTTLGTPRLPAGCYT